MTLKNHFPPNCTVSIQQSKYDTNVALDRASVATTTERTFRAFLKVIRGTSSRPQNSKPSGVGLPEVGYVGHSENIGDTVDIREFQDLTLTFDSGRVQKGRYRSIEKNNALFLQATGSDQVIVDTSEQR